MEHVEHMTPIVKSNLKLQCLSQVYLFIVMIVSGTITVTALASGGENNNVKYYLKTVHRFLTV